MPIPVLIDCDPGYDDVIAIMLALASPEVEVLGITTVEGNQPVAETTENALRVVEFLAREIPVAAGANRPSCVSSPSGGRRARTAPTCGATSPGCRRRRVERWTSTRSISSRGSCSPRTSR